MAEPLKRGDLYFVKPPGFVGKVRPAVVVQADKYNTGPPSVTVCLDKPSQVMIDKIMTLPLDRLDNRIRAASLRDWLDL